MGGAPAEPLPARHVQPREPPAGRRHPAHQGRTGCGFEGHTGIGKGITAGLAKPQGGPAKIREEAGTGMMRSTGTVFSYAPLFSGWDAVFRAWGEAKPRRSNEWASE